MSITHTATHISYLYSTLNICRSNILTFRDLAVGAGRHRRAGLAYVADDLELLLKVVPFLLHGVQLRCRLLQLFLGVLLHLPVCCQRLLQLLPLLFRYGCTEYKAEVS